MFSFREKFPFFFSLFCYYIFSSILFVIVIVALCCDTMQEEVEDRTKKSKEH